MESVAYMTNTAALSSKPSILISFVGVDHAAVFEGGLADYSVTQAPEQLAFLPAAIASIKPHLLIFDCEHLDNAILSVLEQVMADHPLPVLVFALKADPELLDRALMLGIASCVVDGLARERLGVLVSLTQQRFRLMDGMRKELAKTKDMLEARKYIERAKGILMSQRGLKEDEAYEMMRRNAMSQNRTIREVAENILIVSGFIG